MLYDSKALKERRRQLFELILGQPDWSLTDSILVAASENGLQVSNITLRRDLSYLVSIGLLQKTGKAKATRYRANPAAALILTINQEKYLELPPDERTGKDRFNFEIFEQLAQIELFTTDELAHLKNLKSEFKKELGELSVAAVKKEYERITIELSWKSSAIEGNTYDLLETETLLKEGIPAEGKSTEETKMILNHKAALDYIRKNPSDFSHISTSKIEYLHGILVNELSISKGLRKKLVAITGTKFRPIDNEFQVRESMEHACRLINDKKDEFSKALLAILLISYIQPFEDGNKRTSRLLANALLLAGGCFPLSFRSVKILDYKKAILLFYELNYVLAFKKVFLEQAEFAAKNYFRSKF